jgi:hypothetical protein
MCHIPLEQLYHPGAFLICGHANPKPLTIVLVPKLFVNLNEVAISLQKLLVWSLPQALPAQFRIPAD